MKRITGTAIAFTLAAAAAMPAVAMEQELNMLELAAESALNSVGVRDVDIAMLTVSQLATIQAIINDDQSDQDKKRRIEAVISR